MLFSWENDHFPIFGDKEGSANFLQKRRAVPDAMFKDAAIPEEKKKKKKLRVYEEVAIGTMEYDADEGFYTYLCPCGDYFEISLEALHAARRRPLRLSAVEGARTRAGCGSTPHVAKIDACARPIPHAREIRRERISRTVRVARSRSACSSTRCDAHTHFASK